MRVEMCRTVFGMTTSKTTTLEKRAKHKKMIPGKTTKLKVKKSLKTTVQQLKDAKGDATVMVIIQKGECNHDVNDLPKVEGGNQQGKKRGYKRKKIYKMVRM